MSFTVNASRCVGAGVCALAAPNVFEQNDDDGIIVVLDNNPPAHQANAIRDAAARCPAAVIVLMDQ